MKALVLVFLLIATPAAAQQPVEPIADWISWGTAFTNVAVAAVKAARSEHPKCELGKLALSEALENAAAFAIKSFVVSPRPCAGCSPTGMPSGHSGQSLIGASRWSYGFSIGILTGTLRYEAHRHTKKQIAAGWAIGGVSEYVGQRVIRCQD